MAGSDQHNKISGVSKMSEAILYYILLDWGGDEEDRKYMTETEAKNRNQTLWEKEPRFLRWAEITHTKYINHDKKRNS